MIRAKIGDKVRVHYTGKLEGGTVSDTSQNRRSVELTLGNGDYIALDGGKSTDRCDIRKRLSGNKIILE